ncbi:MAG: T9SS C-terminal target domain-containing protein [Flavobacteriales bacterium]|nr:MAG: T9SS C-terminal target domain-containing protein [Flavobacteriales bacterium]
MTAIDGYKDYDTISVVVKSNYIKSLSPNPANQNLNVEYVVDEDTGFAISIMNNSGVTIISQDLTLQKGVINISIQNLISGNYYCRITHYGQIIDSKSFIKL